MTFNFNSLLITGGCGFLGRSLILYLLENGYGGGIRVLDNLSVGSREDLEAIVKFKELSIDNVTSPAVGVELLVGDITRASDCEAACRGIDAIVHFAANTGVAPSIENPRADLMSNVLGTFNMLESARQNGAGSFVFASSSAPLGAVRPPVHEAMLPRPISPYGASKLAGEAYCCVYGLTFGLKTVALRFSNIYGPLSERKQSVVHKFMKLAIKGGTLEIFGDGTQTRDFIYVTDLIRAIVLSLEKGVAGEVYQIATGTENTVEDVAQAIKEIVEEDSAVKVNIRHASERLGDVKRTYALISKAREHLGFAPEVGLKDGLRKTYEYYISLPQYKK